jgi:hypothetical protein
LVALGAFGLACFVPTAALAASNTIDFSGDSPGTQISTQYQSQDVVFGIDLSGAADQPQPLIVENNPNSPPAHVAQMTCGAEVCNLTQWIEFAPAQVQHVSLLAQAVVASSATVTLTAYDASGNAINGASVSKVVSSSSQTQLSVSAPSVEISTVSIHASDGQGGAGFAFTDLTYDPYATTASPYFSFVRAFAPNGASVYAGSSGGAVFILRRFAGSAGPINLSYAGAPQGVTLSFSPNPDSGGDKTTVAVTVAAAPNAPTAVQVPVTITGTASGQSPAQIVLPVSVLRTYTYGLRIQGMEITQGIQPMTLPARDPNNPSAPVPYSGVRLTTTLPAVLRVFADAPNAPAGGVAGVAVSVNGFDSLGQLLPGSPLYGGTSNLSDSGSATVPLSERTSANGSIDIALPASWIGRASNGPISLTATLLAPAPFGSPVQNVVCTDPACVSQGTMTLNGITTVDPGGTDVVPVLLTENGSPAPDPYTAFDWVRWLFPADIVPDPVAGSIDITYIVQDQCFDSFSAHRRCSDRGSQNDWALSWVESFQSNYDNGSSPPMIGITTSGLGEEDTSEDFRSRLLGMNPEPAAVVDANQPLTDVAHEIGHMFGLQHASFECGGGQDNDNDDGGGHLGEAWPPDGQGYIGGIGLDIPAGNPYPVVAGPGGSSPTRCATDGGNECGGTSPAQFFDFMGYCTASDPNNDGTLGSTNTWISARNWNYILTFANCELGGGDPYGCRQQAVVSKGSEVMTFGQARDTSYGPPAEAASAAGKTRVYGFANRAGAAITVIDPTPTHGVVAGEPSPFTVALKARGGRTLAQSSMLMNSGHADGPGGGPVFLLQGALPMSASATEMELLNAGHVIATVKRPPHRPRVRKFALSVKRRLTGTTPLVVHWRASDPDRVRLTVSLDFSSDGGSIWRSVWSGPNTGRFALPRSYLNGTKHAKLRLRVSDGFDQVMLVSHEFTIAPAPPRVTITSPMTATAIRPGATMFLSAVATDDAGHPLTGSALTWYAGEAKLGTGQELLVNLPAHTTRITVVVRDGRGRTTSVSIGKTKPHKRHRKHRKAATSGIRAIHLASWLIWPAPRPEIFTAEPVPATV